MTTVDDFATAKAVADLLKGLDPDRQARVLRWVSESLGIVTPLESRSEPPARRSGNAELNRVTTPGATIDIKSFVASKDPKSDNQFAATVAYFYRFEAPQNQRRESITAEILQEATRLAGRSRLGDPGKTLRNAKDMGYLDAADRGEYRINSVGENLVAMTLPGQGRMVPAKTPRKQTRSKKGRK
jgi:hypothetical protein